jgi:hypothetical protein
MICAATNPGTDDGAMPAKESENMRPKFALVLREFPAPSGDQESEVAIR